MYRVEYLATVDQKDSFCTTAEAFNNLIKTIDGVAIANQELRIRGVALQYEVQTGEIRTDKQRYFHLRLTCASEADLDIFESLLRALRALLHKASGKPPQVLWDDLSSYYAQKAYPVVHELENTLRKLITKFMLINVGLGWASEAVPKEVIDSVRSKTAKRDQNYLYEVDFIQLSNFLFKEYSTMPPDALIDRLRRATSMADIDFEEMRLAIPQSNWDRYFSTIVNCDSEYLRVRWEKVYERRNQIAHNRPLSHTEFEQTIQLCDELLSKLQQAIDSLDQVTVAEGDRELVSESAAISKSSGYEEFLLQWNELHRSLVLLASLAVAKSDDPSVVQANGSIRNVLNTLAKRVRLLSMRDKAEILELFRFRNVLVHETELVVQNAALSRRVEEVKRQSARIKSMILGLQSGEIVASPSNDSASDEQQSDAGTAEDGG